MTLPHPAPYMAVCALLAAATRLLLREGHPRRTRPPRGQQRPHSTHIGTTQQDHDAIKEHDMTDTEPELTEAEKAYNVAQYELFQLGAFGNWTYAPLTDHATGKYLPLEQREAGQKDYNERLRTAQATFEATAIRKAADWLRAEYPGPDLDMHIRRAADALDRHATEGPTR